MLVILVLIIVLVVLIGFSRLDRDCPQPPLPPPLVVDRLGAGDLTPLGVPTSLIRTVYSVVEPPICTTDPERPQAKEVPEAEDVRHILTQATRRMSDGSEYRVNPGHVISSTVYLDTKGIGTYYITCMLHDASTSITMRVALKARYRPGSDEPPAILNIRFDPQHGDPVDGEPCRSGVVPRPESKDVSPVSW